MGHSAKMTLLAAAVMVLVAVGGVSYFVQTRPVPYPIPVGNVSVTVPAGVPYRQLTTGSWNDLWPAWSPNGSLIAYVSDRSGEDALWLMNATGFHAFQASTSDEVVAYPSWNPNSTMVAYWAMNGQDSEIRAYSLSNNISYYVAGSAPFAVQASAAWSPDGSQLAFFENSGLPQLMVFDFNTGVSTSVANVSGSYLTATWASNDELLYSTSVGGYNQIMWLSVGTGAGGPLLSGAANFTNAAVGPNGTISYYSDFNPGVFSMYAVGYGGFNVWVANADGSNGTYQYILALAEEGGPDIVETPYVPGLLDVTYQPAWSPDGTKVVYTAFAAGTGYSMYMWDVVNWASAQIGPLGSGFNSIEPSWSPNGASIAYSSNLGGSYYHIWMLSISGNLTSVVAGY